MIVKNIANECELSVSTQLLDYHFNYLIDGNRGSEGVKDYWNSLTKTDNIINIKLPSKKYISKIILRGPITSISYELKDITIEAKNEKGGIFKYGNFILTTGNVDQLKDIELDINQDEINEININLCRFRKRNRVHGEFGYL